MTTTSVPTDPDAHVVQTLSQYVTRDPPTSFFLAAGAGSGKTWTLTRLLQRLTGTLAPGKQPDSASAPPTPGEIALRKRLDREGRKIGVITYTNIACDQIHIALGQNPLAEVQTIHSFCWSLIRGLNDDIRKVLKTSASADLKQFEDGLTDALRTLEEKRQRLKGATDEYEKKGTKAAQKQLDSASKAVQKAEAKRARQERAIQNARDKVAALDGINTFNYNPDTGKKGEGNLSHDEVLKLASELLTQYPTLRRILAARYPVLLIDECQDTAAVVLQALRTVADDDPSFVIGLIGDRRQRVYLVGANQLESLLPTRCERIALRNNRRSGSRIVELINALWEAEVHGRKAAFEVAPQVALPDARTGLVRLFIGGAEHPNKPGAERALAEEMGRITGEEEWSSHGTGYLVLVLEHALAAVRRGFVELFEPLKGAYELLQFGVPADFEVLEDIELIVGRNGVMPVDEGAVMQVVLRRSQLLQNGNLQALSGREQARALQEAKRGVQALRALWNDGADPLLGDVVRSIAASKLLFLSDPLTAWCEDADDSEESKQDSPLNARVRPSVHEMDDTESSPDGGSRTRKPEAVARAMTRPWSEWLSMVAYLRESVGAATHQGMKGAEHPRVLAVLDDSAARGKLFAYDRFFGAQLNKADTEKAAHEENSIDRTRRLLYVVCSRAQHSLALVLWTEDPARAQAFAIEKRWFQESEIILIPNPGAASE